ncbi:hypothetical protein M3Y99_00865600 [Aphelenchoides fujianensis]|nr:hypothetical protein M3Y99_00865600 [Aphelenchoides fujianensis]
MKTDIEWKSLKAQKNLEPFDCLREYERSNRDKLIQAGDEQYVIDYMGKIVKWYSQALSRAEIANYEVPQLEVPTYVCILDNIINQKAGDKNAQLRYIMGCLIKMSRSVSPLPKDAARFDMRDEEYAYEKNVTNRRQELAKKIKRVTDEKDVKTINDNQYLMYHRAWNVWKQLQREAQKHGDVRVTKSADQDPETMFPIKGFSEILVDTPPLPVIGSFERYDSDVQKFKAILAKRKPASVLADKEDWEMIVVPSMRNVVFDEPQKWRRMGRQPPVYP